MYVMLANYFGYEMLFLSSSVKSGLSYDSFSSREWLRI